MSDVAEPPDTVRLYAPLLDAACGVRLALFRDRHGDRCAVGFTSAEQLEQVLGDGYTVWPLGRRVLRELAEARGVERILIDPVLAAAPVTAPAVPVTAAAPAAESLEPAEPGRRAMDPQVAGALAVCAAAGAVAAFLGELR
jgi:hypothetical protein